MKSISIRLVLGLALTGCTVNNLRVTSIDFKSVPEVVVVDTKKQMDAGAVNVTPAPAPKPIETVVGNIHIRPECDVYKPLPVPSPIRIDFKELEAATTSKEINGIALRNVKELHQQLLKYAEAQGRHFEDYKKRCVLK